MFRNLFILTLLVFGIGVVNISAQAVNEVKTISKGVLNGSATSLPKPAYPPAALAVRADGAVNVEVLVDEDGNVISASAVSGHPLLRLASVQAARGAKFKPTLLDGAAVRVKGVIVYNFVLPKKDDDADESGSANVTGSESSGGFDQIDGAILNGKATKLFQPRYPIRARAYKAAGKVNVKVLIDENGNVVRAFAVSGNSYLHEAAVDAAMKSKFKPSLLNGEPVKVNGTIVYNFVP